MRGCGADVFGRDSGMNFKHECGRFGKFGKEAFERNLSCPWGTVVLEGPADIVDMAAEKSWGDAVEPLFVVEQGEVVFDVGVSEVVPVADIGVGDLVEKIVKLVLGGDGFVVFAVFDGEPDVFCGGVVGDFFYTIECAVEIGGAIGFAFFDGCEFGAGEFFAQELVVFYKVAQGAGEREAADASGVDDDEIGLEPFGHVDGLHGQLGCTLAIAGAMGGEFVAIRVVHHHLGGKGAEVVQAGDAKAKGFSGMENFGYDRRF